MDSGPPWPTSTTASSAIGRPADDTDEEEDDDDLEVDVVGIGRPSSSDKRLVADCAPPRSSSVPSSHAPSLALPGPVVPGPVAARAARPPQMTAIPQSPMNPPSVWHVPHWIQPSAQYVAAAAAAGQAAAAAPLPAPLLASPSAGAGKSVNMCPVSAAAFLPPSNAGVMQQQHHHQQQQPQMVGNQAQSASPVSVMAAPTAAAGTLLPQAMPAPGQHWAPYPTIVPWPSAGAEYCKVMPAASPADQANQAAAAAAAAVGGGAGGFQPGVWPMDLRGAIRLPYILASPAANVAAGPTVGGSVQNSGHTHMHAVGAAAAVASPGGHGVGHLIPMPQQQRGGHAPSTVFQAMATTPATAGVSQRQVLASHSQGAMQAAARHETSESTTRHHSRPDEDEDAEEGRRGEDAEVGKREQLSSSRDTHSNYSTLSREHGGAASSHSAKSPGQEARSDGPQDFRKKMIEKWQKPRTETISTAAFGTTAATMNCRPVAKTITVSAAHHPHQVSSVVMFSPTPTTPPTAMLTSPIAKPTPLPMVNMANVSMPQFAGAGIRDAYMPQALPPMPMGGRKILPGPPKSTGGPLRLPSFAGDKPTSPERTRCPICGTLACGSRSALTNKTGPPRRHYFSCKVARRRLQEWMDTHQDHPYPTKSERAQLLKATGMSRVQLQNWFGNHRRRLKSQRLQEGSSNGSKGDDTQSEEEFGMDSDSDMEVMQDDDSNDEDEQLEV